MNQFSQQKHFSHNSEHKIGVLLINLGTPDAPTRSALKKYLKQFLSSPRIIEVPKWIWFFILNCIILPFRSPKSAAKYKTIWDKQGSPLLLKSKSLTEKLQKTVANPIICALAMNYGKPSIKQELEKLREQNCKYLLVLPLYPQYSATTVAETFDLVTQQLQKWRWIPELRFINQYHDEDLYVKAVAEIIRKKIKLPFKQKLIFSYHGTPLLSLFQGDPYHCQCHKTSRLIAESLGLKETDYMVCFQSRFGSAAWLQPYTDETLAALPASKIKEVFIVCPGFSIDCLETLEEINNENKEIFLAAGGDKYHYIPCLNDSQSHIKFLHYLINKHTQGWVPLKNGQRKVQNNIYKKLKNKYNFYNLKT